MTKIVSAAATGHLTNHGKRVVAESMYAKGKAFLGAAILLRRKNGYKYVVLHLLCQGIEISLKGLLLIADYNKYKPQLKTLGHNLIKTAETISKVAGMKPLRPAVQAKLEQLKQTLFRSPSSLRFWVRLVGTPCIHSKYACLAPHGGSTEDC